MSVASQKEKQNRTFISERLRHALDDCTHKTVSLVEAPTGYGKTVAVRTFVERLDMPIVWINIYDKDPKRAWSNFCRALFSHADIVSRFENWPFPEESVQRDAFFKEFSVILKNGPITVVFDDYHLIQSNQIGEFFQCLSREFAALFHLIIISQKRVWDGEDIAYSTGKINLITSEDLKLKREDVPKYLELFELSPEVIEDKDTLKKLYERSEGWISMIYVSVLNYLRTGKTDPTADMEHLVNKVAYNNCSKNTQLFLSYLTEVQDFSKEQADFFNGGEDSEPYLEELINNHSFVYFDPESQLYHIHTIFVNCIKNHFDKMSMYEKCLRYERMAEYYIVQKDYNKALVWYEKAGNYEGVLRTIELFETIGSEFEDIDLFVRCFDACPDSLFEDYPLSLILFMWRFLNHGESERLQKCRILFEKTMEQIHLAKEDQDYLWQAYYLFLSQNAYNDLDDMLRYLKMAFAFSGYELPGVDPYVPRTFGIPSLYHAFYRGGDAKDMIDKLKRQIDELHHYAIFSLDGIVEFAQAEVCYFEARFDEAELYCHEALRMFKKQDVVCNEINVYHLLAQIAYMHGDMEAIKKYLELMRDRVLKHASINSPLALTVDMCEAFFHVNVSYPQYLGAWIDDLEHNPSTLMPQAEPYSYMLRAAIALHREKFKYILSCKNMMLASLQGKNFALTEGAIYMVLASAASSLGKYEEAKEYIRTCNQILGFSPVMLYARYGRWVMQPLQELAEEDERYKEIIAICRKMTTINKNLNGDSFSGVFPVLTARENDIALLAMDGMSNKQISAQLFISENTVKSSMKNIFSKLGISSRRDLLKAAQFGTEF